MWDYFHQLERETMSIVVQMERNHWLILLGVLMAVGFFCMRGFGSRTSY
jgi:hypothetical protein